MSTDDEMNEKLIQRYHDFIRKKLGLNPQVEAFEFPSIDGKTVIDTRHEVEVSFTSEHVSERLDFLGKDFLAGHEIGNRSGDGVTFYEGDLEKLGLALLPYVSFGVLNGGSATSYFDTKKNQQFAGEDLFNLYGGLFKEMQSEHRNKPKGITPAYINAWGEEGLSYLELKLRHILLLQKRYHETFGSKCQVGFFQMTSPVTHDALEAANADFEKSPYLTEVEGAKELLESRKTGVQNLVWVFESVRDQTSDLKFFEYQKDGKSHRLSLPGGHGQNFYVLKPVYAELEAEGYRYAYLGNIDNLGYTINLKSLALMALKGESAGFEFSFKTSLDKKGGVLVKEGDTYTSLDIGGAISSQVVDAAQERGLPILFNCATGLFSLRYLNENIDYIIENLPVRFVEQNKDIGKYAQAEQVTWEVIALLRNPLIFAVNKEDRFLAAKFAIEMFLTCGLYRDLPAFPFEKTELATILYRGFKRVMGTVYGMQLWKGKWDTKE